MFAFLSAFTPCWLKITVYCVYAYASSACNMSIHLLASMLLPITFQHALFSPMCLASSLLSICFLLLSFEALLANFTSLAPGALIDIWDLVAKVVISALTLGVPVDIAIHYEEPELVSMPSGNRLAGGDL